MSCPNMVWALYRPGLTPVERTVLVHMANVATRALVCWDTMEKIAHQFGMSIRTVHRAVHSLADKKLITIQARFRKPNHYHLHIPPEDADRRLTQPPDGDKNGVTQPFDSDKSGHNGASSMTNPAPKHDKSCKSSMTPVSGVSPKKESPKLSQQDLSDPGLEESKQAEVRASVASPEPEIDRRSLDGLPPGIAAIARRNGWGDSEPTVREVAADRAAASAELKAAGEVGAVASQLGRALGKIAPLPGVRSQRTVDEQIAEINPRPAARRAPLSDEHLALMRATYAIPPRVPAHPQPGVLR